MNLTFRLRFHAKDGQSLLLSGRDERLGAGRDERAIPLRQLNHECWQARIVLPARESAEALTGYHYILRNADGSLAHDWGNGRVIRPADFQADELLIIDSWNHPGFYENAFYTEPFKQVLLRAQHTEVRLPAAPSATHTFRVKAPLLARGQTLCLLGETAALGNWSTLEPIRLNRAAGDDFLSVQLDLGRQSFPFAYKYGVYDTVQNAFVRYEDGPNRVLLDAVAPHKHTVVNDGFAVLPADTWKGAGVAVPVFSLRSERSFGVGEFSDLKLLADWGRRAGLKLIQLLPVNDTSATHTWKDSYPYAAISAFALHPLYLDLSRVADGRNQSLLQKLEPERKRLNALEAVDYEAVMEAKLGCLRQLYALQKQQTFASRDYRRFFADHRHWLVPYAVFCHLRDQYGTSDFNHWRTHRNYQADKVAALAADGSPAHDEIAFNYFVQYHLHLQLNEAREYAHANGVVLKGDLPIGVYGCGADAWQEPGLFHAELQAGAPPDAFAVKGQNWGFPTYNWPRMKEDGFAWWKRRFGQMSGYFDAFRIDHILGFFRIWSIPEHAVEGILGYFVPAIPVAVEEFSRRGIRFDRDRYTRPYITDDVLEDVFGNDRDAVKREFLRQRPAGDYALKPKFATQRQVERHFAGLKPDPRRQRIQEGLYDLISNVILFEAGADGAAFHFRFGMENTFSFQHLHPQTQAQLKELCVDYFYRRQEDFWKRAALEKLPALKRDTDMLVCGEDLGLVPDCVPDVMSRLGLLSLEVQRMPKRRGQEFSRPAEAPYLSVVTPSTHDMSTIRGWWEEDRNSIQRFYNLELGRPGDAPLRGEPWINQAVVRQHLASPAMWSIFQLQDLLGMDERLRHADPAAERINVPAVPGFYWRYRMHLTLEKLLQADAFNEELKRDIAQSGR